MQRRVLFSWVVAVLLLAAAWPALAQTATPPTAAADDPAKPDTTGVTPPAGYVIGPADTLSVIVWNHKEMSSDVVVRPDGMISLPLLNDVKATGLTPDQLRVKLTEGASKFVEAPNVMVIVKEIKSRQVFITGMVNRPSPYPLSGPMNVMQLITQAGGLQEYAKQKDITILRQVGAKQISFKFNYADVAKGKNLKQNIELEPGDTVIVP
jgi:polysaccharide export outer membrane protein